MKKIYPILIFIILSNHCFGQDLKESFTYIKNDSVPLNLDFFKAADSDTAGPLVIFMHGGGFSGGSRNGGYEYCNTLSSEGINATTITYTLYMKGKNFSCEGIQSEKIKAIQLAAYQCRIATQWFIDNANVFGIDTNMIFLAGSSAGAEAILQAAFWDRNSDNYFPNVLAPTFKYAGLISGAGAILDINLINSKSKIPALCYHGTCDPLVPYYIAPHHYCSQISSGFMMMFGGLAIHEQLQELNGSSHLMSYCNEGHKHANTPFFGPEIYTSIEFINRTINNEKLNIHRIFKNNTECKIGLDFVFCY